MPRCSARVRKAWRAVRRRLGDLPPLIQRWKHLHLPPILHVVARFRRGPDSASEWDLLLWRLTFPLLTLVLCTLLAVLGPCGLALYSWVVCPTWYFLHLVLVAHPFLLVFDESAVHQRRVWRALAALSAVLGVVEWGVSVPHSEMPTVNAPIAALVRTKYLHYGWMVGNTGFGAILVGIPVYFYRWRKQKMMQESGEALSPSVSPSLSPSVAVGREMDTEEHRGLLAVEDKEEDEEMGVDTSRGRAVSSSSKSSTSSEFWSRDRNITASLAVFRRRWYIGVLCVVCVLAVWFVMLSSYSSPRRVEASANQWFMLYALSPFVCLALIYVIGIGQSSGANTGNHTPHASFECVVVYSVVVVFLPFYLGHLCLYFFSAVEPPEATNTAAPDASSGSKVGTGSDWFKLAISVLYIVVMQTYFSVMTKVVNAMSEPFAHPSLLYLGQLCYYVFWYLLVGSEAPIDWLYWGMLLVSNVHIAFLNTGIYGDIKESSSACLTGPLVCMGVSASMCFHASKLPSTNSQEVAVIPQYLPERSESIPGENSDASNETSSIVASTTLGTDNVSGVMQRPSRRYSTDVATGFTLDIQDEPILNVSVVPPQSPRQRSYSSVPLRSTLPSVPDSSLTTTATIFFTDKKMKKTKVCCENDRNALCHSRSQQNDQEWSPFSPSHSVSTPSKPSSSNNMRQLYFLMKVAEQDNMADTTALILVPSLLTLLAVLDKPSRGLFILVEQRHLWIRCVCMFIARLGGSYLAREIFTYKLRSSLMKERSGQRRAQTKEMLGTIEGIPSRLWIQKLMLQDFHRQFWFLTITTMAVAFACFERMDLPARFALLL